jgi:hypothetical protein
MNLIIGLAISILVYIIGWHQLYGQFIHEFYRKNQIWLILISVPCTYLAIYSNKLTTEYFKGEVWPNRIISLCIGLIGFYILSSIYFQEKPTIKTFVIISLALSAVLLQIFWK